MFDVNPVPYGDTLSMSVIGDDARIDLGLALSAAPHFGLSAGQAEAEAKRMLERIRRDWRATALESGLSRAAIQTMEPAFMLCNG